MSIQTRIAEMVEILRDIDTSKLMDVRQRCVAMKALTNSSNPELQLWTSNEIQFEFRAHAQILKTDLEILKTQLIDAKEKVNLVAVESKEVKTEIAKIAQDASTVMINYQSHSNTNLGEADSAMEPVRQLITLKTEESFKV